MASDDKEKGSEKKAGGSRKKTLAKKRAGYYSKSDVDVSVESLATKYPIVDWKTHVLSEDKMYYEIIRANRSTKSYKIFIEMLDDFNKHDVLDLYRLVKERLLSGKLEVDNEREMAFELLRFTRSQIEK
ncbi:hypothetical protein Tco_1302003 [Tanacetum coccineum]